MQFAPISPFFQKRLSLIGVDINAQAINLVELSLNKRQYTLENYHSIDSNPSDLATRLMTLNKALDCTKYRQKHINLSIPDELTTKRVVQMGRQLDRKEIRAFIDLDRKQTITDLTSESMDFMCIPKVNPNSNLQTILYITIENQHIEKRMSYFKQTNSNVKAIELNSIALARAQNFLNRSSGFTAIFHVYEELTQLVVTLDGVIVFTQEQSIPNQSFHTQQLLLQLTHGIDCFFLKKGKQTLNHLFFSGVYPHLNELAEQAQEKLSVPILKPNPLTKMKVSSNVNLEKILMDAPQLMIAFGLALRQETQ